MDERILDDMEWHSPVLVWASNEFLPEIVLKIQANASFLLYSPQSLWYNAFKFIAILCHTMFLDILVQDASMLITNIEFYLEQPELLIYSIPLSH